MKSLSGLSLSGTTVTVSEAALNQSDITITGNYTLALAEGIAAPVTTNAHFTLDGTIAKYKSTSNTAGYTLADNKITYTAAVDETELFTITGVKSTDGLSVNGTTVTVSESSLNQSDVTISEGYTLALAEGIAAPATTLAHFTLEGTTATYKSTSNTAGYTLVDNKIIYTAANAEIDLFTLTDINSIEGININAEDKTVTVAASALTTESKSTTILTERNNSGYILVIDNGVLDVTTDDTVPADDMTTGGDDNTLPADDTTTGGDDVTLPADDNTKKHYR